MAATVMSFVSEGLGKNLEMGLRRFEKGETLFQWLNGWMDIHHLFAWRSRTT